MDTGVVDFGSQTTRQSLHRDSVGDSGDVDSSGVSSQSEIEQLAVEKQKKKQQQGPDSVESENPNEKGEVSTASRRLFYGIFLCGGLLIFPGYTVAGAQIAFLILPLQVAGFAMIPLYKKEVKKIPKGNPLPQDRLLAIKQNSQDAVHSGNGATTTNPERTSPIDLDPTSVASVGPHIDFASGAVSGGVVSGGVSVVSAAELKKIFTNLGIDSEDERIKGLLDPEKSVSSAEIRQFCKENSSDLAEATKNQLEKAAKMVDCSSPTKLPPRPISVGSSGAVL